MTVKYKNIFYNTHRQMNNLTINNQRPLSKTLGLLIMFFLISQFLFAHDVEGLSKLSKTEVAGIYLQLGFTHILPLGLDHILFVLSLFLLNPKLKPILWQATAFTVAHTITLGLAIYGVIKPPTSIVEPVIALSDRKSVG